jgi:50S ribosomal protein L16 3-hydroxylase
MSRLLPSMAGNGDEGFTLPVPFWKDFRRKYWEKKGTVLKHPFPPIASPEEVFRCLVRASDRYRLRLHDNEIEFCIEGAALLADVGNHLPRAGDRTARAYAKRVTRLLGGQRFGLIASGLQEFGAPIWFRSRAFVRHLVAEVGLPGMIKATLFMGTYRNTPFGLHRGRSSNFMFVIEGRKRILCWPDAYMRRQKADPTYTLDYRRFRRDAIVLEGEPGDVLYFPSDYWHIGEDAGGLSMAISLMLFMEDSPTEHVFPYVKERLANQLDAVGASKRSSLGAPSSGIPSRVNSTLRAVRALGLDVELRKVLMADCLNRVTGSGFTVVPTPLPVKALPSAAIVQVHPEHPIRWLNTRAGEILCSANGHAFTIAAHPKIRKLLERLSRGDAHRVGDLLREYRVSSGKRGQRYLAPAEVRALLAKLVSVRAMTVENGALVSF